ncbi:MAG: hypothetical protein A2W95_01640 [Bacteroidetes bacterium GWA2_40_14]|nr:MAG: hypothetical protein A2W95_01640 [Bacteroidetes bacterium GWA2_40_14]OFZ29576.1 MAG: hypothetical protein A2437_08735 [Bacteroidetes bacterium RIFOXYC2_FULL_40_12]
MNGIGKQFKKGIQRYVLVISEGTPKYRIPDSCKRITVAITSRETLKKFLVLLQFICFSSF